ncbi:Glutamate--tRNA ligase [bioreactor metagenome]|uniref:Glutamate--tRNA ligase n=1 Tax=bioreactor metagenome TaxID=1076179 RepID=A0A645IK72_9ZZZZ
MPTYNFANVVDDYLMKITHVIRGTEYLSSTPKYNLLYQSLGYPIPYYLHLPPVMKDHSKKLSKRDGDASYEDFIKKGYLKDALINYIALLGWSPGDDREKFTLKELEQVFSVSGINKAPAIFDVAKLTWLNAEYIRDLTHEAYTQYALPYYKQVLGENITDEQLDILAAILQPRT